MPLVSFESALKADQLQVLRAYTPANSIQQLPPSTHRAVSDPIFLSGVFAGPRETAAYILHCFAILFFKILVSATKERMEFNNWRSFISYHSLMWNILGRGDLSGQQKIISQKGKALLP